MTRISCQKKTRKLLTKLVNSLVVLQFRLKCCSSILQAASSSGDCEDDAGIIAQCRAVDGERPGGQDDSSSTCLLPDSPAVSAGTGNFAN